MAPGRSGPQPIQRPAQRVQHPAEPGGIDRQRSGRGKPGPGTGADPLQRGEGERGGEAVAQRHDLPRHRHATGPGQVQPGAETQPGCETFD